MTLFVLVSVIDCFTWFWMESLHKNIHVILKFLKAPFLVLYFEKCRTKNGALNIERERERDRQTNRQTDRQTDRHRQTERQTERDRQSRE